MSDLKENVTLSVRLVLTPQQLMRLAGHPGQLRADPRKGWTVAEAKEHARLAVRRLVDEAGRDDFRP